MTKSLLTDSLNFEIEKDFKFSLIDFYTLGPLNLMLNIIFHILLFLLVKHRTNSHSEFSGYIVWQMSLITTWMSNIIFPICYKSRLQVSVNLCQYGPNLARLRRRRAYAPTSNTASYDYHEKINSWVFIYFRYGYETPLGCPSGRRRFAIIAVS